SFIEIIRSCSTMSGAKSGSFSTLVTAKRSASVWPGQSNAAAAQCTKTRLKALDGVRGMPPCSPIQAKVFSIPRTSGENASAGSASSISRRAITSDLPREPSDAADDVDLVGRSFVFGVVLVVGDDAHRR